MGKDFETKANPLEFQGAKSKACHAAQLGFRGEQGAVRFVLICGRQRRLHEVG